MSTDELIKAIIEWGEEKGINNPEKQFQKLAEEMLEAHEAYEKARAFYSFALQDVYFDDKLEAFTFDIKEELGDIGVVWILLCNMLDVDPFDALEAAHNKNKDRKGKTINGSFVKEEDL